MVLVRVRQDNMVDVRSVVVRLEVLNNLSTGVEVSAINDVHSYTAINGVANRNGIATLACFHCQEIKFNEVGQASLLSCPSRRASSG